MVCLYRLGAVPPIADRFRSGSFIFHVLDGLLLIHMIEALNIHMVLLIYNASLSPTSQFLLPCVEEVLIDQGVKSLIELMSLGVGRRSIELEVTRLK